MTRADSDLEARPLHMTRDLSIGALGDANRARIHHFRNARGEAADATADGSDWSLLEWAAAVCGEAGELANVCKKIRRGDLELAEPAVQAMVAGELADMAIYLEITARQAGINLSVAIVDKFNATSVKIGSPVRLHLRPRFFVGRPELPRSGTRARPAESKAPNRRPRRP